MRSLVLRWVKWSVLNFAALCLIAGRVDAASDVSLIRRWLEKFHADNNVSYVAATPGLRLMSVGTGEKGPDLPATIMASTPTEWPKQNKPAVAPPPHETPPLITSIRQDGDSLTIEWIGNGTLQAAADLAGPWHDVPEAKSPFRIALSGPQEFYRVKQ